MSLLETVERVRESLERNGRISYRMLRREFLLDEDTLDELIEEQSTFSGWRPERNEP